MTKHFEPTRGTRWGACLGALGLALLGSWFATRGERAGWLLVASFGPVSCLCAASLLPGACRLSIDDDGFRLRSLFRSFAYRWDDMAAFRAVRYRGQSMVAYRFDPAYPGRPWLRALSRALWGFEGAILPVRELTAEELAQLLEARRRGELR